LREPALDKLAAAVMPMAFAQTVRPRIGLIPVALDLPFCDEIARGNLTSLTFQVRPWLLSATGTASGTWCQLSWSANVTAHGAVIHDPVGRTLRLGFSPSVARAIVQLPGWFVAAAWFHGIPLPSSLALDFPIDLSRSLGNMSPIPLQGAAFSIESPGGPRQFVLAPGATQVLLQDGYIELRGNLVLQ
jgi:hypothetical protein